MKKKPILEEQIKIKTESVDDAVKSTGFSRATVYNYRSQPLTDEEFDEIIESIRQKEKSILEDLTKIKKLKDRYLKTIEQRIKEKKDE